MAISALGYACIGSGKLDQWEQFACGVMGLQSRRTDDGALLLRYDVRDWRIRVEPGTEEDVTVLGWECLNESDFDDTLARLGRDASLDPGLAKARGVRALARFVDPAGFNGELYWGPTEVTDQPFASPIGVSGFVTGNQGLGHIAVSSPNADAFIEFYLRLGMKVSDYIDMRMGPDILPLTFLYCNPRHHTLAAAPAPSPKRCLHLMVQTQSFDDVGYSTDRAAKLDVPIAITLGRHSNDEMVSVYYQSPSGFEFEYGWGAREIEGDWQVVRHDAISKWGHKFLGAPNA